METYELSFPNHCSAMSLYMVYVSKCHLAYWRTFSLPGYCCLCSETYCRSFDISGTSVGNIMVDHSDVVGASPVGAAPTSNYIFILNLTPGINGLGKDKCKKRQETFKFLDLVWIILEIWWYLKYISQQVRKWAIILHLNDIKIVFMSEIVILLNRHFWFH